VRLSNGIKKVIGGGQNLVAQFTQLAPTGTQSEVALDATLNLWPFRRAHIIAAPLASLRDDQDRGRV